MSYPADLSDASSTSGRAVGAKIASAVVENVNKIYEKKPLTQGVPHREDHEA
jgi:hypothetical protein